MEILELRDLLERQRVLNGDGDLFGHLLEKVEPWTSQTFADTVGWSLEQGEDQWGIDGERSMSA